MSKLAHSNQETMDEIEKKRLIENGDEDLIPPDSAPEIELIYQQVGLKIRALRGALGMTQEDLAKRLGLSRASIANIEVGRQRMALHDVEHLCGKFGMSPKHFLRGIWT